MWRRPEGWPMADSYRGARLTNSGVEHAVSWDYQKETLCRRRVRKPQLLEDDREWDRDATDACLRCKVKADQVNEYG